MNWAIFFAFLSPALFGLMNVFDTYVLKKRVKSVLGFAIVSGITNILLGIILASFLDWSSYSFSSFVFPIFAGVVIGTQLCFYYIALARHDVSHAIGLIYIYPLIVAFLSYFFLNEKLSSIGYLGTIMTLLGVLLMTIQIKKLKITLAFWSLGIITLSAALNDFFIKLATNSVGVWQGTAIGSIVMGSIVLPLLFKKTIRQGFFKEFKKIRFTFISESLTIAATVTLYLAMQDLGATVVSVISATQPLFVLFFEWIAFFIGIKIVEDIEWKNKLFAILLIIAGIIIIYSSELI
ncbi:MAG: EamA family transporter [Candidatus Pacearchaeota archaeon]